MKEFERCMQMINFALRQKKKLDIKLTEDYQALADKEQGFLDHIIKSSLTQFPDEEVVIEDVDIYAREVKDHG